MNRVEAELKKQGLRLADGWENGRYVTVTDHEGRPQKVWVTDDGDDVFLGSRRVGSRPRAKGPETSKKEGDLDEVDGHIRGETFEAEVDIVSGQAYAAVEDGKALGLKVFRVPGFNTWVAQGDYDALMSYLTDYLSMSAAEADVAIRPLTKDVDDEEDPWTAEERAEMSDEEYERKRDTQAEGLTFDKFMDATLIAEARTRTVDAKAPSPQRLRAQRRQERPQSRTRWGTR